MRTRSGSKLASLRCRIAPFRRFEDLELLLAAAPKITRIGILTDRQTPGYAVYMKNVRRAIEHFRVEARFAEIDKTEEIEPAIARLAKENIEGLVVLPFSATSKRVCAISLSSMSLPKNKIGGCYRGYSKCTCL